MSGEIVFYMKGADAVMTSIVQYSDWLEEEVHVYTCTCVYMCMYMYCIAGYIGGIIFGGLLEKDCNWRI